MFEMVLQFVEERTPLQLLALFWYFIIFDFTRYVLSDVLVLFYVFFTRRRREKGFALARKRLYSELPLISVIAPGKNEAAHIPELARSLRRQTYPNIELIIVDDGSDDETAGVCRTLQRQGLLHTFLRNPTRGGKASAANLGLRYCKGRYVVHMDADSHLRHDSIERIILPFYCNPEVGAVAGDIRVANSTASIAASCQAIEYMRGLSVGRTVNSMFGILRIVSGAYGAFRRDILDRLGGWDVGPGLDGDITLKIRKLGYKVEFDPLAICYTNVPETFIGLTRQRVRWDRSLVRFRLRKHVDMLLPGQNFRWSNFFTSLENVVFNLVLNVKWWVYFVQMVFFNTENLHLIVLINFLLYLGADILEFSFACLLYGATIRRSELLMLPAFLPLMPIYTGYFIRTVRTYAYLMEAVFRMSYLDKWNPWKTSRAVEKERL